MRSVFEMETAPLETVQDSTTVSRLLSYLKENRTEVIAIAILVHLLGLTERVSGHLNGVCF